MTVTSDLPAGNIKVVGEKGNEITLDVDMRDSEGSWFYWKFKAMFPSSGAYRFHFTSAPKIGTCGPAISLDHGATWKWQQDSPGADDRSFTFECKSPGEVWFCQAMPYMQREFDAFAGEFQNNGSFHLSTLCKSRRGRPVELLTIGDNANAPAILITSRHHAQEMMATHAMEGFLRATLDDNDFGREFRRELTIYAVPFVDKDGVEDGDQGKNRIPHDHGRDYASDSSIYPECAAIRKIIDEKKPFFILDMHCPWIRGGACNERIYMVDGPDARFSEEMNRFGVILERKAPPDVPYFMEHNIPFGTAWNTPENYKKGLGLKHYGTRNAFVKFAQSLEIPFSNVGNRRIDRESMLKFGKALAQSILIYAEQRQ